MGAEVSVSDIQRRIYEQRELLEQSARSATAARARLEELLVYQRVHREVREYVQDRLASNAVLVMEPGIDPGSVKVLVGMTGLMTELLREGDTHVARLDEQAYLIQAAINRAEDDLADIARQQNALSEELQSLGTQLTIAGQKEANNEY